LFFEENNVFQTSEEPKKKSPEVRAHPNFQFGNM
jgi:hypothetical protein